LADEHLRLGHSVIIDAVNPTEAPRAVWRKLAVKHRASLKIIECTCANEITHRQRVAARVRNIESMPELCWEDVLVRRAAYEAWTDMRLVLDTSANDPSVSMARAIEYLRN